MEMNIRKVTVYIEKSKFDFYIGKSLATDFTLSLGLLTLKSSNEIKKITTALDEYAGVDKFYTDEQGDTIIEFGSFGIACTEYPNQVMNLAMTFMKETYKIVAPYATQFECQLLILGKDAN